MSLLPGKIPVTLKTSQDWDEWISHVKLRANNARLWEFHVNVDSAPELPPPLEPARPTIASVAQSQAATLADLNAQQTAAFTEAKDLWKVDYKAWERKDIAYKSLAIAIYESIATGHKERVRDEQTNCYKMLQILKRRLQPTDQTRKEYL